MQIRIGDTVVWESQAMGCWKEKRGRVIAIVPANTSIEEVWPEVNEIPKSRRKWDSDVSQIDRALVEVPSKRVCYYYAPRLSWLQQATE